eukprot:3364772-Rhodomonas_salina.1
MEMEGEEHRNDSLPGRAFAITDHRVVLSTITAAQTAGEQGRGRGERKGRGDRETVVRFICVRKPVGVFHCCSNSCCLLLSPWCRRISSSAFDHAPCASEEAKREQDHDKDVKFCVKLVGQLRDEHHAENAVVDKGWKKEKVDDLDQRRRESFPPSSTVLRTVRRESALK